MSDLTTFSVVSGAGVSSSVRSLARVEKPSRGNDLHNETSAEDNARDRTAARVLVKHLSHSETDDAPVWHGPRLSAPFVAQILGQVLPQSAPDAPSIRDTYRKTPPLFPTGIFFDGEI